MKNYFLCLLILLMSITSLFAQHTYLTNQCEVLGNTHNRCKIYKYNGSSSSKLEMAGGEVGYGGFGLWGEGSYVTFSLKGQYETLTFTMGHYYRCSEVIGAITIKGDGKKIFDEKLKGYELPRQYSLNVKGVNELTFTIAINNLDIIVANAILWKAGETPVNITKEVKPATTSKELVKSQQPYFISNFMNVVTPDSDMPIKLNGQEYQYGLRGSMDMALIGVNKGYAYFNLGGKYAKVSFIAGCRDDVTGQAGSGWVTVKADDKIIEEIEIKEGQIAKQVTLDIPNCKMLSFHTEQISGNSTAEIANIVVYPEGEDVAAIQTSDGSVSSDSRLKSLPDVCKLISNIPPYQVVGTVKKQIYDGSSDYLTFSMGGVKYSEGIILYQTASFFNDNLSACATFDMGNEFDYISFTAGYVGKSWNMNSDVLMVYADDELVFSTSLVPTFPNQHFVVPIKKCRILRFTNKGSGALDVAAFGVADIVAYRGEPVENDLFVHPKPDCPHQIDLIDLGRPYVHYVSSMSNYKDEMLYDGTTKKLYFDLNGERIYKGFVLKTSTHFSLDFGVLGDNGSDAAAAGAIGAAAVGASFVASGVAVGGLAVGATLAPIAAFLMLAAGGEAVENSCAAFNTYGEYNSVTFKVACLAGTDYVDSYHQHLMIAADHKVVANIGIYEGMEPQEITVPIDGCEQLMFWLANTGGNSEKFLIYDIVVSKDKKALNIPIPARISLPQVTEYITPKVELRDDYSQAPQSYKSKEVDEYLVDARIYYDKVLEFIEKYSSEYKIYTYYFESSRGICKAVQMRSYDNPKSDKDVVLFYRYLTENHLKKLNELRAEKTNLVIENAAANAGLLSLGLDAVKYRKFIKEAGTLMKQCFEVVDQLYEAKMQEYAFWKQVVPKAMNLDGVSSTDRCIICPITSDDKVPDEPLQHLQYFNLVEH